MNTNLKIRVGTLVLGVTLAVAGSAFKPAEKAVAPVGQSWFLFNGGDVDSPNSYTEIGSAPSECIGEADLCAILAEENGNSGKPTEEGVMNPAQSRHYE